jgi:2-aminoethylphosphonate-pyruvate transaminase
MILLTPGPVTTRPEVRAAAAQDFAPWDSSFRPIYGEIRQRVGALAGDVLATHAVLPLQGAGHFAVEAVVRSLVPPEGRLLIPLTGNYAERMIRLAREVGRDVVTLPCSDTAPLAPEAVARALAQDPAITHVGQVYSETSSGVVHDAQAIGAVVRAAGRRMILDAVSAFGALPVDLRAQPEIDAAIFTANKCLEGLPGLSCTIARIDTLERAEGRAQSWSFDLHDIYRVGARDGWGSFRFTPPASIAAALLVALRLHAAEGGSAARLVRYEENAATLHRGARSIGLVPYLDADVQGPIVLNVHAPGDPAFTLLRFVDALKARGFLISNFYHTLRPSFRVGCIGAIDADVMRRFVGAMDEALREMGVRQREPV